MVTPKERCTSMACFNYNDLLGRIQRVNNNIKQFKRDLEHFNLSKKRYSVIDHRGHPVEILAFEWEPAEVLCSRAIEYLPLALKHKVDIGFVQRSIPSQLEGEPGLSSLSIPEQIEILDCQTRRCTIKGMKPSTLSLLQPSVNQSSPISSPVNSGAASPFNRANVTPPVLAVCTQIPLMTTLYERVVRLRPLTALLTSKLSVFHSHIENELRRVGLPDSGWSLVMCRLVRDHSAPATQEVEITNQTDVDDDSTIEQLLKFDNYDMMVKAMPCIEKPGTTHLTIFRLEGPSIRLFVEKNSNIGTLRETLATRLDCAADEIHLTAFGVECTDEQILSTLFLLPDRTESPDPWRITLTREKSVLLQSTSHSYPVRFYNQPTVDATHELVMYQPIKAEQRHQKSARQLIDWLCTAYNVVARVQAAVLTGLLVGVGKDGSTWIDPLPHRMQAIKDERFIAIDDDMPILPRIQVTPPVVEEIVIDDDEPPAQPRRKRQRVDLTDTVIPQTGPAIVVHIDAFDVTDSVDLSIEPGAPTSPPALERMPQSPYHQAISL